MYPPRQTLINYCCDDLTADERLLTHWLTYICDRQMSFRRVWEIGGYVFSHLVRTFERSDRDVPSLAEQYVQTKSTDSSKIEFQCPKERPNERLEDQERTGGCVRFASRFPATDALGIFRTLALLDTSCERQLARFVSLFVSDGPAASSSVLRLAVALHGLTYAACGRPKGDECRQMLQELPDSAKQEAQGIRQNPSGWLKRKQQSFHPLDKKRLWCALRDYLKSPEFNPLFVQALREAGVCTADRWKREKQELRLSLDQLELPGDVWNNNEVFASGLFVPYLDNKLMAGSMPRTIRDIYESLKSELRGVFYPEQLDVTFDFVPRMCKKQMCHECLFGGGVASRCHCQEGRPCEVLRMACGYEHLCQPAGCAFKSDDFKGICRHWPAPAVVAQP